MTLGMDLRAIGGAFCGRSGGVEYQRVAQAGPLPGDIFRASNAYMAMKRPNEIR